MFTNDFAALLPDVPAGRSDPAGLFRCEPVRGECRVICFSPRHDLTLPEMEVEEVLWVVNVWADQVNELGAKYRWVQIFENKGEVMGCSNPHPHGQIWAAIFCPALWFRKIAARCIILIVTASAVAGLCWKGITAEDRVIEANPHWVMRGAVLGGLAV